MKTTVEIPDDLMKAIKLRALGKPHTLIGDYLGVSKSSVSRLFTRLTLPSTYTPRRAYVTPETDKDPQPAIRAASMKNS